MLRDNFFYILLGLIAVILIGVTIGLQLMLLSGRSSNEPPVANPASVTQPVASANSDSANESDNGAVAMVINTPTSTPIVIAVEPAAVSDNPAPAVVEATPTIVPPTIAPSTVVPPTIVPPTIVPPTIVPPTVLPAAPPIEAPPVEEQPTLAVPPTEVPAEAPAEESVVQPTEEPVVPPTVPPTQLPATATAVVVEPTSTPFIESDFTFAYIDGRSECTIVTNVIAELFEQWGWSTQLVQFATIDGLFEQELYEGSDAMYPDMTFCYRDPEDREQFFTQNGTGLELISSGYTKINDQKHYILAHSSVPAQLRYENACILNFLKNLEFDDASLSVSSASEWFTENADLVQSWERCEASAQ